MLKHRRSIARLNIRHRMRPTAIADQQAVTLGKVPRALGGARRLDQAAIGLVRASGRNALRDDARAGILADVDHLGARIGLLHVVGNRDGVKLALAFSPSNTHDGYFQVIAEPVSTCVHDTLDRAP